MTTLLVNFERCRQKPLDDAGIRPKVQQHAASNHAFDHGEHRPDFTPTV
jgi:hypothetical protein